MIDKNIDKINEISKSKNLSDSKYNVYFDKKFEGKELFNAFIFFLKNYTIIKEMKLIIQIIFL